MGVRSGCSAAQQPVLWRFACWTLTRGGDARRLMENRGSRSWWQGGNPIAVVMMTVQMVVRPVAIVATID